MEKVGIIGAGTMGSGIAINLAQNGVPVCLVDLSAESLERARAGAEKFYQRAVERERMSADDAEEALNRINTATDLSVLAGSDLVIEAVFERADIKAEVFGKLNEILAEDAVIGTNTSCLEVSALANDVKNPSRFLGVHYFNPPAVNPIVEVIRGEKTDPAIFDGVLAFIQETGKKTVACADRNGFAINRFFVPYANEAARLYDEGVAQPAEIDRVATDVLGVAAGPFVVMNLVGMQVMLHAQENLRPLGAFYEPAASLLRLGPGGETWEIGEPSPPVSDLDKIIGDRLLGATFLPVLQEIDEGVASPADIDMGAKLALKFGKPPCSLMDEMGADAVRQVIEPLCQRYETPLPESLAKVGSLAG